MITLYNATMTNLSVAVLTRDYFIDNCCLHISGNSYTALIKWFPTHRTPQAFISCCLVYVRSQAFNAVTTVRTDVTIDIDITNNIIDIRLAETIIEIIYHLYYIWPQGMDAGVCNISKHTGHEYFLMTSSIVF